MIRSFKSIADLAQACGMNAAAIAVESPSLIDRARATAGRQPEIAAKTIVVRDTTTGKRAVVRELVEPGVSAWNLKATLLADGGTVVPALGHFVQLVAGFAFIEMAQGARRRGDISRAGTFAMLSTGVRNLAHTGAAPAIDCATGMWSIPVRAAGLAAIAQRRTAQISKFEDAACRGFDAANVPPYQLVRAPA